MMVRDLVRSAADRLGRAGVPTPEVDAQLILAHVVGTSPMRLSVDLDPSPSQVGEFESLIDRRARREPLQHLLGTVPFRYVEVEVGPGVFVPRPETELLAGWGIEQVRIADDAGRAAPVVVDLCTGSGVVAKAVAHERPEAQVYAVEISEAAVAYASRNLAGSGVDLRTGDIADVLPELDGRVDVVLANPPYIPLGEYESVAVEVRDHDPAIALWSGDDGLDTIRVVERAAHRLLRPGGMVGCEHADVQGESVPALFRRGSRWLDVRDHRDLAGRPRYTTARRV